MDSSSAFRVTPQNNNTAHALLHLFIQEYGLGQRVPRGYKPAKLILEMFERVTSKDAFLEFFFSSIYERLEVHEESEDIDMAAALSCLETFAEGTDLSKSTRINGALEGFAEYIVDNFLLPRMTTPYPLDLLPY